MAYITARKHALGRHIGSALAVLVVPFAAHAAPQAAAQTLEEIKVVGSAENDFKAEKASSPKYTEKLVDTAQSVTVIKKELIQQQGAVTLTEALRNTPGVGAFFLGENGNSNTGDAIYMRGFDSSTSIYVDGVRDIGSISRDIFNIDQIDVLKGPAGTDNGRASPTGSVNLVTKQGNLEEAVSGTVLFGSAKQRRMTVDVNHVLNADKGIAFRLNTVAQDSGNPARDVVNNKRWALAPSLAFGLNGPTRVFLNYLHVDQDNTPDGGVPTIGLPGYTAPDAAPNPIRTFLNSAKKVDPHGFYGSNSDYDRVKADMFTVKVEHDFSPTVKLQNIARFGRTSQDYLLTAFTATTANLRTPVPSDPATWTLARLSRTVKDQTNEIMTNQSVATVNLETGALKHTLVGGLELTMEKQTNIGYLPASLGALAPSSVYAPNPASPVTGLNLTRNGTGADASVSTQSLYLFDTIKLGEKWIFNAGARMDHFNMDYAAVALQTAANATPALPVGSLVPTKLTLSDTLVNGKVSALYKPTANSSVYALVATSKQPPGTNLTFSTNVNSGANPKYEPQASTTTEVGTKWDFLKQKLSVTAAVYRTTVKNEVEQDPVDLLYYQTGRKQVQGVELGVTGEVSRNWLVSAGYARMDTSVESGRAITANGNNSLTYTPKDAFTAWTSYTLPMGVKIGGGARYVGKLLRGTDGAVGTPAWADAYWVVDAMASYTVSKNLDLQFNLYNLADKDYIAAINKSGYRYTPGAPRSASLTANFRF
ncbi:MAG: catecholate siderophore receptor Fiu [Pseudomonadota bacterium]